MPTRCMIFAMVLLAFVRFPVCAQEVHNEAVSGEDLNYQLLLASYNGDSMKVKILLEIGANVNTATYDYVTPLMYASQNGNLSIVRMLVDHGASLDQQSYEGYTALISAARSGWIDVAEFLIQSGANINLADNKAITPLMYAAALDQFYISDMLLFYEADFSLCDQDGISALMIACQKGYEDIAFRLIDYGADVNAADKTGRTVLHFAVIGGDPEIIEELLLLGVDVEKKSDSGYSPLAAAVTMDDFESARLLIGYGADVNSNINNTINVLSLAVQKDNAPLVDMLIKNGAQGIYRPSFNIFIPSAGFSFNQDNTEVRLGFGIYDHRYGAYAALGCGIWIKPMQVLERAGDNLYFQFWERRYSFYLALNKDIYTLRLGGKSKLGIDAGIRGVYSYGNHAGSDTKANDQWLLCPTAGMIYEYSFLRLALHYEHMDLNIYKGNSNRVNLTIGCVLNRKRETLNIELNNRL